MTDVPRVVRIVSTKYDGTLRDSYQAQFLDHAGSVLRFKVPAGTPVYEGKRGRVLESEDNAIEIYFTDRWYNVWHLRDHTTYPNLWYANMATPARFDGGTLRWVDLDIDVRCYLDGSLQVLDEDEFERNCVEMSYPDDVVQRVLAGRDEVLRLAKDRAFPFDHETQIADAAFG